MTQRVLIMLMFFIIGIMSHFLLETTKGSRHAHKEEIVEHIPYGPTCKEV
jgi:hypothetical protein